MTKQGLFLKHKKEKVWNDINRAVYGLMSGKTDNKVGRSDFLHVWSDKSNIFGSRTSSIRWQWWTRSFDSVSHSITKGTLPPSQSGFSVWPQQADESACLRSEEDKTRQANTEILIFHPGLALVSVWIGVFWAACAGLSAVDWNHLMSWSGFLVINIHILTVGTSPFSMLYDTQCRNDKVKKWLWSGNVFFFFGLFCITTESKLAGCSLLTSS